MKREEYDFSLNELYASMNTTKQAFHQYYNRLLKKEEEKEYLLHLVYEIREDHPQMGCRDMYYKLEPESIGRDAFEEMCKREGFAVRLYKNYRRTTDSSGVKRFENLVKDLKIDGLNQVWVSDITYYHLHGRFYYLTFVEDAYSRRILGHSVSKRLYTEVTTLRSLHRAIQTRAGVDLSGLIFHSDGGGQYYDDDFLALTAAEKIKNSMCKYPWDNPQAERLNGVIKNNYLRYRNIECYRSLVKEVDRTVNLYNEEKPHINLDRMTPNLFEYRILATGKQSDGEKSATESESH